MGPAVYLEDLYVTPEFRRRGLGREFFKELSKVKSYDTNLDNFNIILTQAVLRLSESKSLLAGSCQGERRQSALDVRCPRVERTGDRVL
jgi:GNAT superfamily N-acetyltransferase